MKNTSGPATFRRARASAKEKTLLALRTSLGSVPNATTPWEELEARLREWTPDALHALHYRVHAAMVASFEDGALHGREDDMPPDTGGA